MVRENLGTPNWVGARRGFSLAVAGVNLGPKIKQIEAVNQDAPKFGSVLNDVAC
jgi:hypothetical protein